MAQPHSVKILEVGQVAPSPDLTESAAAPKYLPLTFFDILWLRKPQVERLFFYPVPSLITTKLFLDSIVPKLKHSLSLTLHHYLPLAGTLTWPQDSHKPILTYVESDGVSFTVAESTMDFHDLSSDNFRRQATKCRPLLPNLSTSHERASALALQVTVFPNCGFCVGIASHHAILDGKTSTSFMKAWAHICKSELNSADLSLPPELTPFYDRAVFKDPDEYEAAYLNEWLKLGGPNNRSLMLSEIIEVPCDSVRGTFELTQNDIEKLRKHVGNHDGHEYSKGSVRFSTFSIVCGYTWVCLVKALEKLKGNKEMMVYSVDCRPRLKPAIPSTYFGNCVGGSMVFVKADDIVGGHGVVSAVVAFTKSISNLDHMNRFLISKQAAAPFINSTTAETDNEIGVIAVAGSPRFEVYSTDFGWGKPKTVEMTSIVRPGAICMSESKNGNGGVEIELVLKMGQMEAFASFFDQGLQAL